MAIMILYLLCIINLSNINRALNLLKIEQASAIF